MSDLRKAILRFQGGVQKTIFLFKSIWMVEAWQRFSNSRESLVLFFAIRHQIFFNQKEAARMKDDNVVLMVKVAPSGPDKTTISSSWVNVPDLKSSITTSATCNLSITVSSEVGGKRVFLGHW